MDTHDATEVAEAPSSAKSARGKNRGTAAQIFLGVISFVWLFPMVYALYISVRPVEDTNVNGNFSLPRGLTLSNYSNAWTDGQLLKFFTNTLIVLVPSVIVVLLLSSMAAFVISRYKWRYNLFFLMLFTAGNLLPQQAIIVPLFRLYLEIPMFEFLSNPNGRLYDSYLGVIAIHVAFQFGFCTFVLSNFMKALPKDLNQAAMIDGAGPFRIFWEIILPLTRPALAALATLQVTWIYNDYFWARTLQAQGDQRPITSALAALNDGLFQQNDNLLAAGSILVVLPVLFVYLLLQRQFLEGLTLGSTKG